MAVPTSTSANLSLTVSKVIAFLTSPLDRRTIGEFALHKLKLNLEGGLTALYAPTWRVDNPLHKSGNRRLRLTPISLPPQPIYDACISAGLQWYEWMTALGNVGFDLYADPGCVSICYHNDSAERDIIGGKYTTIWVDSPSPTLELFAPIPKVQPKTFAQKILENDHEDVDHLFRMIAHETRIPPTPIHMHFSTRSLSPQSAISEHSRSSSRSSNSSSTFSSDASSTTSLSTAASSVISAPELQQPKQSRRERARQGRVFVDRSKNVVTPYDGGKTTVLTGGVMLGDARYAVPRPSNVAISASATAASWRSAQH